MPNNIITTQHWQGSFGPTILPKEHPEINMTAFHQWICNVPHSVEETVAIMKETCPYYNNFHVFWLDIYAEELQNARIYIAREGSVCMYIDGIEGDEQAISVLKQLCADEIDVISSGQYRVWWD